MSTQIVGAAAPFGEDGERPRQAMPPDAPLGGEAGMRQVAADGAPREAAAVHEIGVASASTECLDAELAAAGV